MELPCIVTDINGSREIIVNGENGVIIPSKDAEALYQAMKAIVTDKAQTAHYAAQARQMIADRFEQSFVILFPKVCLSKVIKKGPAMFGQS